MGFSCLGDALFLYATRMAALSSADVAAATAALARTPVSTVQQLWDLGCCAVCVGRLCAVLVSST